MLDANPTTSRGGSSARGTARPRKVTPARFMEPRVMLLFSAIALAVFGLLMVWSASSVLALNKYGDALYFLKRQAGFLALALIVAAGCVHCGYRRILRPKCLLIISLLSILLLAYTRLAGAETNGATRWISVAGIRVQPSELSKIGVLLVAAYLAQLGSEGRLEWRDRARQRPTITFWLAALGVAAPMLLILLQPDKGTTLIVCATLFFMSALAGLKRSILVGATIGVAIVVCALIAKDGYALDRVTIAWHPWTDPYGDGYQLMQGFYAFGNGGLLGVGLGMSRQKYSYLPEAHNDFILAVVGEEFGLLGVMLVLAAFGVLLYSSFRIARHAPDRSGALLASSSAAMLCIQLFVNLLGVVGITPMTGKPVPFLSYGGSSIFSSVLLVAAILSVSRSSALPKTVYDRRRDSLGIAADTPAARSGADAYDGGGSPPSGRAAAGLTLVDGGVRSSYKRVDLGPSPRERLRGSRSGGSSSSSDRSRPRGRDDRGTSRSRR